MKTKKKVLITTGIVLLFLLICFLFYLNKKTYYNEESDNGNSAGNLYNKGIFCQYEDKIYFSNPKDDGTLYSMDTDLSSYKKLSKDKVNYINVSGHYIIYNRINNLKEHAAGSALVFKNVGVYRIDLNGNHIKRFDDTPADTVHQFGNDIYYLHYDKKKAYSLYSVRLNGDEQKEILTECISPAMVTEEYLYYTGVINDHNIHRLSRDNLHEELVKEGNYSQVVLQGDSIYAIDNEKNHTIVQMALDGTGEHTLVNDRVATYNLSNDGKYLFYQVDAGDHNGVCYLNLSTGEQTLIQSGDYQNLCITEDYLFFNQFKSTSMYYVELSNPTVAKPFLPETD